MNENNNNHSDKETATALVVRTIVDQIGCAAKDVSPEKTLRDLGLDSLDDVELVMAFEEELDLSIPDEDIEHFKTVGEIIDYVEKILRRRGEP
jgi:acyl carrier protein